MATGNAVDFKWYQYTADDASTWSYKTDKTWGDNAASGMGAFSAADPVWPKGARYRARQVVLQDLVSGRRTLRVLGTAAATAGVSGATVTAPVRGAAGTVTLTSLGIQGEKRPRASTIISKPEPITS
jgi:hypothetical protein